MCIKMSDVRLSNASPTLERVDARQPDSLRQSVRRSLFGSPDPEELREIVEAARQEEVCRFRDTYNFDPVEDRPLPAGNFEWKKVNDAPEFYRRPPHKRPGNSQRDQAETPEGQTTAAERSRKRPSGSCCSESLDKRSRTNGSNKDDEPDDDTSQAVQVSEEAPEDQ